MDYSNGCKATPAAEISLWMEKLAIEARGVEEIVGDVRSRVQSVLRPANTEAQCQAKDQQAGCDLACQIQDRVIGLQEVRRVLADILDRLEL